MFPRSKGMGDFLVHLLEIQICAWNLPAEDAMMEGFHQCKAVLLGKIGWMDQYLWGFSLLAPLLVLILVLLFCSVLLEQEITFSRRKFDLMLVKLWHWWTFTCKFHFVFWLLFFHHKRWNTFSDWDYILAINFTGVLLTTTVFYLSFAEQEYQKWQDQSGRDMSPRRFKQL